VRRAVESSLRRLRTDWIDLYQFHRPDPATPILETLDAMNDLIREGKIRYIGHSNFAGWQVADADWTARSAGLNRPISSQSRYSLLERGIEREVVPAVTEYVVGLIAHTPLSNGLLTGKYRRGEAPPKGSRIEQRPQDLTDAVFDQLDRLQAYADQRGVSMLDVAIGGLAAQPAVTSVIVGATSATQVKANVAAGEWRPSEQDLAELDQVTSSAR
jgi:aryl-alcohol dehydrogenase-like predicted oxidoreductase